MFIILSISVLSHEKNIGENWNNRNTSNNIQNKHTLHSGYPDLNPSKLEVSCIAPLQSFTPLVNDEIALQVTKLGSYVNYSPTTI
jgi:hypothetical protein